MELQAGMAVILVETSDDRWWVRPGLRGTLIEIETGSRNLEHVSDGTWEDDDFYHVRWDNGCMTIVNPQAGDQLRPA